jgi:hippurate hydrolase
LPHQTPDAVLAAAELVSQLHTIVSRRVPPTENAVLSVTRISGGQSHNVLPSAVELTGTVRSFDAKVQDTIERAVRDIAAGVALGTGTRIEVQYVRYYPATINTEKEARCALEAARQAGLQASVASAPAFTSEDFAFMLQQRPGAYLWLGQGGMTDSVPLHQPSYDFNDDALAGGVKWFVAVARLALESTRDEK